MIPITLSSLIVGIWLFLTLFLLFLIYFSIIGLRESDKIYELAAWYSDSPLAKLLVAIPLFGPAIHESLESVPADLPEGTPAQELFKQLWGLEGADRVVVVAPELGEKVANQEPLPNQYLYLGKFGDIDSLMQILICLSRTYPNLEIEFYTDKEFESMGRVSTKNLITIGGPGLNLITQRYIGQTPFSYAKNESGDWQLVNNVTENTYQSKNDPQPKIDHGVFVKRSHPRDPTKKLIMIHGITTYGVYGAALGFASQNMANEDTARQNCEMVVNQLGEDPEFAIRFEVLMHDEAVGTPQAEDHRLLTISSNQWHQV